MKVGQHQDRMAEDVTVINVPEVRQALHFPAKYDVGRQLR